MSHLEDLIAFQIRAAKLPAPEREYKFNATRRWRSDFAWPEYMLLVECEGATWSGGRHTRGAGYELDCEKYSNANIDGWCVVRATAGMIKDGRALVLIERAIARVKK